MPDREDGTCGDCISRAIRLSCDRFRLRLRGLFWRACRGLILVILNWRGEITRCECALVDWSASTWPQLNPKFNKCAIEGFATNGGYGCVPLAARGQSVQRALLSSCRNPLGALGGLTGCLGLASAVSIGTGAFGGLIRLIKELPCLCRVVTWAFIRLGWFLKWRKRRTSLDDVLARSVFHSLPCFARKFGTRRHVMPGIADVFPCGQLPHIDR
ncbi:hypothetical protein SAMN02745126_00102 [Enhydrobacter aerosaccus]|uniref:Uncharacterized protein n=1 Tax=Enhydrobacter aerosaccus TaxID=225324 RepID=A0A1T4JL97_9HYPH|nr:hypothetical protein SAMN02745126_00102 [Enhydrobacter aerosaccus]